MPPKPRVKLNVTRKRINIDVLRAAKWFTNRAANTKKMANNMPSVLSASMVTIHEEEFYFRAISRTTGSQVRYRYLFLKKTQEVVSNQRESRRADSTSNLPVRRNYQVPYGYLVSSPVVQVVGRSTSPWSTSTWKVHPQKNPFYAHLFSFNSLPMICPMHARQDRPASMDIIFLEYFRIALL